jgi:hypothetical protein
VVQVHVAPPVHSHTNHIASTCLSLLRDYVSDYSGRGHGRGLRAVYNLNEDVGHSGLGGTDHMCIHAECDRGDGMTQAGSDHMHRHAARRAGRRPARPPS